MLEGLNLSYQFGYVAADLGCQYFHSPNDKIWINDESTANIYTGIFVVNAVDGTNPATLVR